MGKAGRCFRQYFFAAPGSTINVSTHYEPSLHDFRGKRIEISDIEDSGFIMGTDIYRRASADLSGKKVFAQCFRCFECGLIRLGVLYVTVVLAVLTSASKGEKPRCEFGLAAGRPGRMPPWRPLSASPMTRFGVPARFVGPGPQTTLQK